MPTTASAGLAVTDELWKSAQAVAASIVEAHRQLNRPSHREKTVEHVDEEILAFTQAARRELGIVQVEALVPAIDPD